MLTLLLLLNSFNSPVTNEVPTQWYDYPEMIEACATIQRSNDREYFESIWCTDEETLRYINEQVRHPNY